MRPRTTVTLLATILGALALAPAAGAQSPLEQYQSTGRIDPCTATGGMGDIPNDIQQYAPDFLEAYRDAQRQGCNSGGVSETAPTETDDTSGVPVGSDGTPLPPGSTFVPKPPVPTEPKATRTLRAENRVVRHQPLAATGDTTAPAPIIALAVMLLLALIGAALAATWRYMGWGLDRLDPVRHGLGEAGMRAGGLFSGLADRVRGGLRRRA